MSRAAARSSISWLPYAGAALVVLGLGALLFGGGSGADAGRGEAFLATVKRTDFEETIRRPGVLAPKDESTIRTQVHGTILTLIEHGAKVEKGDVLLTVDSQPTLDRLELHKSKIQRLESEQNKERQAARKEIRKAEDDVAAKQLALNLEALRLKDLKKGPGTEDDLNAKNNLTNATMLYEALKEEVEILDGLATNGFVSKQEARQKRLELTEQQLRVEQADIAYKKLHEPDEVIIAEQDLKVRDAQKRVNDATERVAMLKRNFDTNESRHKRRMVREHEYLKELNEQLVNCVLRAPMSGVALIGNQWGLRYGPGREVRERSELMTLSNLDAMKAEVTVDEGRIAKVVKNQRARIRLLNPGGQTYEGKVLRVAEKGRDEFEDFRRETKDITGEAGRQVFKVEVTLDGTNLDLRPGLRVEVELVVNRLENALVVPRAAVIEPADGDPFVRVQTDDGVLQKSVKIVAGNSLFSAIEGVEEGQRVWLVEP